MVARGATGAQLAGVDGPEELFSEAAGRVVASVAPEHVDETLRRAGALGVPVTDLGSAGGGRFVVAGLVDLAVDDVVGAHRDALPLAMAAGATH
jgi:hypothetical protein